MSFENGVFIPPPSEDIDFGVHQSQQSSPCSGYSDRNGRPSPRRGGGRGRGGNREKDRHAEVFQRRRDSRDARDYNNRTRPSSELGALGGGRPIQSDTNTEERRGGGNREHRRHPRQIPGLMAMDSEIGHFDPSLAATSSLGPNPTSFYPNPDAPPFQPRTLGEEDYHQPELELLEGNTNDNIGNINSTASAGRQSETQMRNFRRNKNRNENDNQTFTSNSQGLPHWRNREYVVPQESFQPTTSHKKNNNGNSRRGYHYNSRQYPTAEEYCENYDTDVAAGQTAAEVNLEKEFEQLYEDRVRSKAKKPDIRNQRETLSDQLTRNAYDCMICVEKVRRSQPIWSCLKCYNVFHLSCVAKWATSSRDEVGWRCPGCQSYYEDTPAEYRCFCGATKNPNGNRSDVPHTCGQTCGKKRIGGMNCTHSCTIICHPGPCPPCEALESRNCCCGRTSAQVKCSSKAVLTCESICDKLLNCELHVCTRKCHAGVCDPCAVISKLKCHCEAEEKELICDQSTSTISSYTCSRVCDKLLNCKKHNCEDQCHTGSCKPCKMSPEAVLSCPCGQTSIAEACFRCKIPQRKSCTDPIPTCGKLCGRILSCGEPGKNHKCSSKCHLDKCPSCPLVTNIKCRCGSRNFELSCETFDPQSDVTCEKKCAKKRSCGRHKCNVKCCIDQDHICSIVCGRGLRCGNHNCSLLCHNGHCLPCRIVSFSELACECGASVIYPPIACGTKPPPCPNPCSRIHDCDHPIMHNCHSDPECPPCTFLTEKWCHGKHELRKHVKCHIQEVSCGMPCKALLACGRHKCTRICHSEQCLGENESCKMPCEIPRKDCGHPCGGPCHDGDCPESRCKLSTEVTCTCGRKKETMICWKREKEYDRLVWYLTNIELKRLREAVPEVKGEERNIDENEVLNVFKEKTPKPNVLECDKECSRLERNRKMMEALQLEDPDATSTFGTPNYSEFLITFAKKNPQFVENVHDRLTNLVVKAKRSKRKNETYGFESMNRDKRRIVHEYSDHFGCLSESFDDEPNRNVICTASKAKSYLPAVSLIDAVFKPNMRSERKNAFNDVEIFQNSKSHIMRPANGKIWANPSCVPKSGMVSLAVTTSSNTSSNTGTTWTSSTSNPLATTTPTSSLFNGEFPPLS